MRISDWSSDVCSSDLAADFLGCRWPSIASQRQGPKVRRRTRRQTAAVPAVGLLARSQSRRARLGGSEKPQAGPQHHQEARADEETRAALNALPAENPGHCVCVLQASKYPLRGRIECTVTNAFFSIS